MTRSERVRQRVMAFGPSGMDTNYLRDRTVQTLFWELYTYVVGNLWHSEIDVPFVFKRNFMRGEVNSLSNAGGSRGTYLKYVYYVTS